MKEMCLIVTAVFLFSGVAASRAANLPRISNETGVSVDTLRAERTSTGLGWGELENALSWQMRLAGASTT
jgi:hypothetical protein